MGSLLETNLWFKYHWSSLHSGLFFQQADPRPWWLVSMSWLCNAKWSLYLQHLVQHSWITILLEANSCSCSCLCSVVAHSLSLIYSCSCLSSWLMSCLYPGSVYVSSVFSSVCLLTKSGLCLVCPWNLWHIHNDDGDIQVFDQARSSGGCVVCNSDSTYSCCYPCKDTLCLQFNIQ